MSAGIRIVDLPPTPAGKTGWPWTEASGPMPSTRPDGSAWPRISIITPSFNQGRYIEETIRSVLLQGYPNLEYIIIDGGSTDETLEVIRKYETHLTFWVSERDRGQSHAINKGLDRCTGDVAAYINSDDTYLPGALAHIGGCFAHGGFDVFVGRRWTKWPRLWPLRPVLTFRRARPFTYPFLFSGRYYRYELPQECVFWNHGRFREVRLDEGLNFAMDKEFFLRIFSGASVVHSTRYIGVMRIHPESKSCTLQDVWAQDAREIHIRFERFADGFPNSDKLAILRTYRRASWHAALKRCFGLRRDFTFRYRLPDYLGSVARATARSVRLADGN